jgi:hypothetical protein
MLCEPTVEISATNADHFGRDPDERKATPSPPVPDRARFNAAYVNRRRRIYEDRIGGA